MKFNKSLIIISLLIIFCVNLGVVSATDLVSNSVSNDDVLNTISADEISVYDDVIESNVSDSSEGSDSVINDDVGVSATLKLTQSGSAYYSSKVLNIELINSDDGSYLANEKVALKFSNGKSVTLTTDEFGEAQYKVLFAPGTYSVTASVLNSDINAPDVKSSFSIVKASAVLRASKVVTNYNSGESFQVKVYNTKNRQLISGVKIGLRVYTGKKYKNVYVTTDSNGVANYDCSKLDVGTHKIIAYVASNKLVSAKYITSSAKINHASLLLVPFSMADETAGAVGVAIFDKKSIKPLDGVKLAFKIYTGKKYKTIYLISGPIEDNETGEVTNGMAMLMTNAFSVGTHKVSIMPVDKNYKGSTESQFIIYKSAKLYSKFIVLFSSGKTKFKLL